MYLTIDSCSEGDNREEWCVEKAPTDVASELCRSKVSNTHTRLDDQSSHSARRRLAIHLSRRV